MIVKIKGNFITIGQLLKKINIVDSGGQTKHYLQTHTVLINQKQVVTRGTKVKDGDFLWIDRKLIKVVSEDE
ncbi:RNA-binding S4 domain-containing protein [Mesomycoplasma bovoculi]|uniref:RNA binding protein n=1 Tax=Mesomycoplasma bovoculi M165/69 TaxID=743966 RepID=W5US24_9BACT|nr:RNA-binding S4 domain-containing protein [Mesomycoplasma bovoculi]AHH45019.1 RNA binding protein [Mesomycoplasma bovoculi M165/69]